MSRYNRTFVINKLINFVPSFPDKSSVETDDSLNVILGTFALFVQDAIKKADREVVEDGFDFINYLLESKDEILLNLVRVEIFEILVDNDKNIKIAQSLLNEKGNKLFIKVYKFIRHGVVPDSWKN